MCNDCVKDFHFISLPLIYYYYFSSHDDVSLCKFYVAVIVSHSKSRKEQKKENSIKSKYSVYVLF